MLYKSISNYIIYKKVQLYNTYRWNTIDIIVVVVMYFFYNPEKFFYVLAHILLWIVFGPRSMLIIYSSIGFTPLSAVFIFSELIICLPLITLALDSQDFGSLFKNSLSMLNRENNLKRNKCVNIFLCKNKNDLFTLHMVLRCFRFKSTVNVIQTVAESYRGGITTRWTLSRHRRKTSRTIVNDNRNGKISYGG